MTGHVNTGLMAYKLRLVADTARAIRLPFESDGDIPERTLARIKMMPDGQFALLATVLATRMGRPKTALWWDRVVCNITKTIESKGSSAALAGSESSDKDHFYVMAIAMLFEQIAWLPIAGKSSGIEGVPDSALKKLKCLSRYDAIRLAQRLNDKGCYSIPKNKSESWWLNMLDCKNNKKLEIVNIKNNIWDKINHIVCS